MIVSGGGELVGITPWSARVERKGMCGSMTYSKLRIKGRLNELEETDWGAEVDTRPPAAVPAFVSLPADAALDGPVFAMPGPAARVDLAAPSALLTARAAKSFDRDDLELLVALLLGGVARGSSPGRGDPVGRPRNDSTRQRTTSSTELSSRPCSVTTRSTSPWSTSTVVTVGFVLGWSRPGRYAVLIDHPNAKAPAAVNARGSEGRIRDRAAGTANAARSHPSTLNCPQARRPAAATCGRFEILIMMRRGSDPRTAITRVLGLWNPGQGSTRPLTRRVGVPLNNQPSRFTLLCQTFV